MHSADANNEKKQGKRRLRLQPAKKPCIHILPVYRIGVRQLIMRNFRILKHCLSLCAANFIDAAAQVCTVSRKLLADAIQREKERIVQRRIFDAPEAPGFAAVNGSHVYLQY